MKILVTGAGGMLGSAVYPLLQSEGHDVLACGRADLDVSNTEWVITTVEQWQPEVVMHFASLTDVDHCQNHPEEAYRVNALGAWNVAVACRRCDALMFYISTDGVYDGAKGEPYTEYDPTAPLSVYSKSKLAGEQHVREHLNRHFILRAGWMFGGGEKDKKFVAKILSLARQKEEITAVMDKVGSPIYTEDLAAIILKLMPFALHGTYNVANQGWCSRYEFACKIVEYAGLTCRVRPVSSDAFPSAAPRPAMAMIRNFRLQLVGMDDLRPWQDALRAYLESCRPAEPISTRLPGV